MVDGVGRCRMRADRASGVALVFVFSANAPTVTFCPEDDVCGRRTTRRSSSSCQLVDRDHKCHRRCRCLGRLVMTRASAASSAACSPLQRSSTQKSRSTSSAAAPTASRPHLTALRLHFIDHRIFESIARHARRCRYM